MNKIDAQTTQEQHDGLLREVVSKLEVANEKLTALLREADRLLAKVEELGRARP